MSSIVNLIPESLNYNTQNIKGTRLGNASIQRVTYTPNQNNYAANGTVSWNIPIASENLVESQVFITTEFTLWLHDAAYTSLNVGMAALENSMGVNSFPVNRCVENATVKFNGELIMSTNVSENVNALQYMMSPAELESISPCNVPDNLYAYDPAVSSNVLQNNADTTTSSRGFGAFEIVSATHANTDEITLVIRVTEQLCARPFQYHTLNPPAFAGLNDLNVSLNLCSSPLDRAFAMTAAPDQGAATCTITKMELRVGQFSPHLSAAAAIPSQAFYNVPIIEHSTKALAALVAGTNAGASVSVSQSSDNRSYSNIPKLYAVYAQGTRTYVTPERLYPIQQLSINSGIKKNLLSSYTKDDLFQLSKNNGFNKRYAQFTGGSFETTGTGCVVYFTPSDIDSEEFHQSNVMSNYVFNVTAQIGNYSGSTEAPELHVVTFSDSVLKYDNGHWSEEMASVMPNELPSAQQMFFNQRIANHVLGGSIWTWLRDNVVKPVSSFARNNLAQRIPVVGSAVSSLVKDGGVIGKRAQAAGYGKKKAPAKKKGGSVLNLGGKKMSNAELLKLLN